MMDSEEAPEQDLCVLYLQQGVPEAFKILFFTYYPELFHFAVAFVHDRDAAQQAGMAAFWLLWERRVEFDSDKKIKTFLFMAVRNSCLYYMRDMAAAGGKRPEADGQKEHAANIPASLPKNILQDIFDFAAAAPQIM